VQSCTDPQVKDLLARPWTIQGGIPEIDTLAHRLVEKPTLGSNSYYGLSKALLNAYTVWLGKSQSDVVVNSCSPGFVETDLTRNMGATKTPDEGATPVCWLMMTCEEKEAGRYYGSDCVRSPLDVYRDPGAPAYDSNEDVVDLSKMTASKE
jgi:NAD(P)-dependent dehydrogenase (short-subunit alcohol dehydrogenase family)